MTVRDAITRTDDIKFNTYSDRDKIAWLSELDGKIMIQIMSVRDGRRRCAPEYTAEEDMDTELLVQPPYDVMYLRWLEAQIDYANNELDSYNAAILRFNEEYEAFEKYYSRTHTMRSAGTRFLF